MFHKHIQRLQIHPLARSVHALEGRAEGNHIQTRELLKEETALQSGVYRLDDRLFMEEFLIGLHADFQNVRIQIRLPARILREMLRLGAGVREILRDGGSNLAALFCHGASLARHDGDYTLFRHPYGREISGCLRQTLDVFAPGDYAVRAGREASEKILAGHRIDGLLVREIIARGEADIRFVALVLLLLRFSEMKIGRASCRERV